MGIRKLIAAILRLYAEDTEENISLVPDFEGSFTMDSSFRNNLRFDQDGSSSGGWDPAGSALVDQNRALNDSVVLRSSAEQTKPTIEWEKPQWTESR
jgi:hypothetical protein